MTLEQGWLHALILAHLVRLECGCSELAAVHWAETRVRSAYLSRVWVELDARDPAPTVASHAIASLLRSIHRDAWAS